MKTRKVNGVTRYLFENIDEFIKQVRKCLLDNGYFVFSTIFLLIQVSKGRTIPIFFVKLQNKLLLTLE